MEKRYYYTDPLAAAWMARHFGMAFERSDGDLLLDFDDMADDLAIHIASDLWDGKYFVHPDSLHLLEPLEADLYATVHGCGWLAITPGESWKKQCYPFRIIQRDGKPFHWPEPEQ